MGVVEKISEVVKDLPEPLAREVLDFAERMKAGAKASGNLSPRTSELIIAKPLSMLAGGLKHSALFAGDPVEIQRGLRGEWR